MEKSSADFYENKLYMLKPGKYTPVASIVEITKKYPEIGFADLQDESMKEYILLRFAGLPQKEKEFTGRQLAHPTISGIFGLLPQSIKEEVVYKINFDGTIYCVPGSSLEEIID